jgi:hypothetical protein
LAEQLDEKEVVIIEELLKANTYQTDALVQLLNEKGIITQREFFTKLKNFPIQYQNKG